LEKAGFGQSVLSFEGISKNDGRAAITELPDIDDEGFQLLKRQDRLIVRATHPHNNTSHTE
jgi:hypothetical protein